MPSNSKSKLKRFVQGIRLNAFFVAGLILAGLLLFIPQIQNVLTQTVESKAFGTKTGWYAFGFLSFLFLAGVLSAASILGVNAPRWPKDDSGSQPLEIPESNHVIHKWACGAGALLLLGAFLIDPPTQLFVLVLAIACFVPTVTRIVGTASGWLFRACAHRFKNQRVLAWTGVLLLLISILTFVLVPIGNIDLPLQLLWQFVAMAGMVGFWLLVSCLPYEGKPSQTSLLEAPGRVLGWFILVLVGGEACWLTADLMHDLGGSFRLYTIWGVTAVAALIVVLGSMVDRLLETTDWPVRFFSILTLLFVFVAWWAPPHELELIRAGTTPKQQEPATPRNPNASTNWYDHFAARIESLDKGWPGEPKAPVVLVAASGGGSRAAVFTALTLEMLEHQWLDQDLNRTWADHILMISGVSGGSLASAHYAHQLTDAVRSNVDVAGSLPDWAQSRLEFRTPLRHVVREDAAKAMRRSIRQELKKLLESRTPENSQGELSDEELASLFDANNDPIVRSMVEALRLYKPMSEWYWAPNVWVVQSGFVDDMWADFMAPIIRGALTPAVNRGESLRNFWTREFEWGKSQSGLGYDAFRSEGDSEHDSTQEYNPSKHPIILFNTCDVRLGTRVVAGFPPLPRQLLRAASEAAPAGDRPDMVRRPRVLDESDAPAQVRLADAVGMSANFPFGFNLLRVDSVATPSYEPDKEIGPRPADTRLQSVNLIDGGFVDNTGIDMIYEVFRGLWAVRYGNDAESDKAKRILDLLTGRVVVLLEIDSGSKPEDPSVLTRIASLIMEPVQGWSNVSYTNAELTKRMYLAKLTEWLDELKAPPDWLRSQESPSLSPHSQDNSHWLRHIPFICNHLGSQNVMTAWALGPRDKGEVLARFLIEAGLRKADFDEYKTRIEQQREVKRRENVLAQTVDFVNQLESLSDDSPDAAYQNVRQSANKVTVAKSDLEKLAEPSQSTQAVQGFLNKVEKYVKQSNKPDPAQIMELKEAATNELSLEKLKKAAQDRPTLLKTPMSKPVDSRQFFDRRPVQKK